MAMDTLQVRTMGDAVDLASGKPPAQFKAGRCVKCSAWLSRYNPHTICTPCRRLHMVVNPPAREREVVGRGPLLPETPRT